MPEHRTNNGVLLPVFITIYGDKSLNLWLKLLQLPVLLMEAAKSKKGSAEPNRNQGGFCKLGSSEKIAETKMQDLNAMKMDSAMKMVAGTARSLGITVTGTAPWNKIHL
jgi:large subunit ribosomal protein L11